MKNKNNFLIKTYLVYILLFISVSVKAQNAFETNSIHSFTIKQSQLSSQKLAVFALDTLQQNNVNIAGTFVFSVNGLSQSLLFKNGESELNVNLKKSSFLYVKFENESNNPANLYYVYKTDNGLNPFKVNLFLLLIIPVGLILIGYMFKKVIGIAIFLVSLYFYFNHSNGLSFGTFFQTIFDAIKNLF